LAPPEYYSQFDLANIAAALNDGLVEFGKRSGMSLSFDFCQLGMECDPTLELDTVRSSIEARNTVWQPE
jgi:hypothetical protein